MVNNEITILGIETSCDETAISIVKIDKENNFEVVSNQLLSQAKLHSEYGGVFPALAKREHAKAIIPILKKVLEDAKEKIEFNESKSIDEKYIQKHFSHEPGLADEFISSLSQIQIPNIDAIAVTEGPGLEPALWVGINVAEALSKTWNIPLIPINHMEGHIVSAMINRKIDFPALALLISGGHTELVLIKQLGEYKLLGSTKDDAVGESFDKVARMLNLPYPGGPQISKLADEYRKLGKKNPYKLPRPMIKSGDDNFSFAGLKTAVLYLIKKLGELNEEQKMAISEEFENAVSEVLVTKTIDAADREGIKTIIAGGGVIANRYIRQELENKAKESGYDIYFSPIDLSTDNAVMIASVGCLKFLNNKEIDKRGQLKADGNKSIDSNA